jgi:hypothetical protein
MAELIDNEEFIEEDDFGMSEEDVQAAVRIAVEDAVGAARRKPWMCATQCRRCCRR